MIAGIFTCVLGACPEGNCAVYKRLKEINLIIFLGYNCVGTAQEDNEICQSSCSELLLNKTCKCELNTTSTTSPTKLPSSTSKPGHTNPNPSTNSNIFDEGKLYISHSLMACVYWLL